MFEEKGFPSSLTLEPNKNALRLKSKLFAKLEQGSEHSSTNFRDSPEFTIYAISTIHVTAIRYAWDAIYGGND